MACGMYGFHVQCLVHGVAVLPAAAAEKRIVLKDSGIVNTAGELRSCTNCLGLALVVKKLKVDFNAFWPTQSGSQPKELCLKRRFSS